MPKALITGGFGFIGQHLAHELLCQGWEVVIVDNGLRGKAPVVHGTTNYYGDIRRPEDAWFAGVDFLFNLAAVSSVRRAKDIPEDTWQTNAQALWGLMRAAKEAGVRRFVETSSREVLGNALTLPAHEDLPLAPINLYGESKAAAEKLLCMAEATFQVPVALCRLTNVVGDGDFNDGRLIPGWVTRARRGENLVVIGGLDKSIDFVPVSLVVTALLRAAITPQPLTSREPINIGSGFGIGLETVFQRVQGLYPQATLVVQPSTVTEVEHFAADVTRMRQRLGLTPPADPLAGMEHFTFR